MLKLGVLSALLVGMLFSSFVLAGADGALVNNIGGAQTGIDTPDIDSGGTQAVAAGTVYHLDLDADSSTNYWAGVWGNVSGSIQLREVNGAVFLSKDMSLPGPESNIGQGVRTLVFAYNVADSVPLFASISTTPRSGGNIDAVTGVSTSLTDSAANLFTESSYSGLVVGTKTINSASNSAWGSRIYDSVSGVLITPSSLYMTMALNDSTNNLLFVTQARDPYADQRKMFDNATFAHYQMLLYVNNSGTANTQNYEFFLELR